MQLKTRVGTALTLLVLTGVCTQQAMGQSYVERMAEMDAQIRLLHKESELNAARRASTETLELPTVLSIHGMGDDVVAQIVFRTGVQREVRAGDQLAEGAVVYSIAPEGVVVRARGRDVALEAHSPKDTSAPVFEQGQMAPLPPLPPVGLPGMHSMGPLR